jgi:superfamily II DNA or RNA helicase
MKIINNKKSEYKYSFVFDYSEKMEMYCKSLNKNGFIIFSDKLGWRFNDIEVIKMIRESFPQVELTPDVEMDLALAEVETSPFVLRDYQKAAVEEGVKFMMGPVKKGGLLVLGTGSGKSLVIASIAQRLPGKTIVLQPS